MSTTPRCSGCDRLISIGTKTYHECDLARRSAAQVRDIVFSNFRKVPRTQRERYIESAKRMRQEGTAPRLVSR